MSGLRSTLDRAGAARRVRTTSAAAAVLLAVIERAERPAGVLWQRLVGARRSALAEQQHLSAVYAASPSGIVQLDLDLTILAANAAFLRLLDRPAFEVLGRYGPDLFHPDGPAAAPEALPGLLAGGQTCFTSHHNMARADGVGVPVRLDWGAVRDTDGQPQRLVCVVTDMTEQAALRSELERARERAEVLWREAPVGVVESTPDGTVTSANTAFAKLLGYSPEELVGMDTGALAAPEQGPSIAQGGEQLLHGEGYVVERRYLHKNGTPVPVLTSGTVLHDALGAVERFAAFVVDLTELHAQRQELHAVLEQVARQRAFMEAVLETVDVGIRYVDANGTNLCRNRAERAMSLVPKKYDGGRPQEAGRMTDLLDSAGRPIAPDDLPLVRVMRGEDPEPFSGKLGPKGGPHRDVVVNAKRVTAADGEVLGAVVSLTDVTAERTALRELAAERAALSTAERAATEAKSFFEAALVAVPDYTVIADLASGAVLYGTPGKTLLGLSSEQLQALGTDAIAALVHPDDQLRMRVLDVAAGDLEEGQVLQLHYRARHADGSWRWLARRVTAFRRDPAGRVTQVLAVVRDVTDVVHAEDRLRHSALHDGLTGLPNRALLHDRLGEALLRAREACEDLAVIFLDLDGFKCVNDGYGHSIGDEVLRVTAARLRAALRKQDTVARVGGDEFVVLVEQAHRLVRDLTGCSEELPAEQKLSMREYGSLVAHRLIAAVADPIPADGHSHRVTASAGVRIVGPGPGGCLADQADTADGVLRDADIAMYEAKGRGKNRFVVSPEGPQGSAVQESCCDPGSTVVLLPSHSVLDPRTRDDGGA